MRQTAKLFMNGRSQAVRLPAEFRFEGKEVYIERQGEAVILKPKAESLADWLESFYERHEPFPDDFLTDRQDTPPQDRAWFHDEDT
ncbi:antitoxin [Allochromatium tepidum]|uniref:Antitoxin n=1 Tax=Allochromatium tepidum TaxID=553982 RepID=A0ABN6GCM0_9GAMM|nr:type II toxin-antitoxin system VapB family antitoxin [Allochromatium tepidum]BCU07691.1 antitoxin [Allochromatium tepidum]